MRQTLAEKRLTVLSKKSNTTSSLASVQSLPKRWLTNGTHAASWGCFTKLHCNFHKLETEGGAIQDKDAVKLTGNSVKDEEWCEKLQPVSGRSWEQQWFLHDCGSDCGSGLGPRLVAVILCSYCCLCCRCCCLTQKLLQQLLLLLSMATARHGMNHFTSECGTHKCTRAHSRTKCRLCFDLIWRFRGHRLKLYEGSSSIKRESFLPSFFHTPFFSISLFSFLLTSFFILPCFILFSFPPSCIDMVAELLYPQGN